MKTADQITNEQLAYSANIVKDYSTPFIPRVPNEINKNIRNNFNAGMISFAKGINKDIPNVVQGPYGTVQGSGPVEGTNMSVTVG